MANKFPGQVPDKGAGKRALKPSEPPPSKPCRGAGNRSHFHVEIQISAARSEGEDDEEDMEVYYKVSSYVTNSNTMDNSRSTWTFT